MGVGADMMVISREEHKIHCTLCFGFKASNNEAEYKAFIVGVRLVKELQACNRQIYNGSQLVVNQVNDRHDGHLLGESKGMDEDLSHRLNRGNPAI